MSGDGEAEQQRPGTSAVLAVLEAALVSATDPDQARLFDELIRFVHRPPSTPIAQQKNMEPIVNLETGMIEQRSGETSIDISKGEASTIEATIPASRSVSLEPAVRTPPIHPSRREVRLARHLEFGAGPDATAPDAGWYQDPGDERQLRWYDGSAWSERTYPVQPALA